MFRNLTLALVLSMSALAAFAIPKPSEVKAAFASGNYVKAESLLKEVMQERPTAAVHYQLGQVYAAQGKHSLALNEMRQAQVLDPTLKFASSAQAFTKALATEQTLVAPPPVVIAQQSPPVSSIADSAYSKTYSNPREVAQPIHGIAPVESSGSGMMILVVILVLAGIGGVIYLFMGKKEKKDAAEAVSVDTKEKTSQLLGFAKSLEDALLITKTATYNDAMKRRIMDRIQGLQVTIRNSLGDLKDGKGMSASRLVTLETNVANAVDNANNGEPADAIPDPTYVTPAPAPAPVSTSSYSRPTFAPSPTQSIHHYPAPTPPAPVIVQNSNDGLLTGVLIGSMMNGHQDRVVERTVYVDRTPAPAPAPYYAPAPAPYVAPVQLDTSDDDRNDSYSSNDSPSIDSSPASDDTY